MFELTPAQKETQEWAARLSRELILPKAELHSRQKISKEFLKTLGEQGLMSLLAPETMGGGGLDAISYSLVIKEVAKACGSVAVTVSVTNMIIDTLLREGTEAQVRPYIERLSKAESVAASFCLTENHSGSDASALKTRAEKKGNTYEISGEKIYVTNGAFADLFLVMARTSNDPGSKSISAFLVDRRSKGFVLGKEEDKMGLTGSSTIRLSLDHVIVPESARLGPEGEGFKIAMRALDGGRISISAQALGVGAAALEAAIRYSKERESFGKPIADYQAIQWKIADSATSLQAAELLMLKAAALKTAKKNFTREASMAKVFATESAVKVAEEAIQIHGGYGYIKDYPVERFYRDVRVTMLYEGTSEIQRLVIARDLLKKGIAA